MSSLYLNRLTPEDREKLIQKLHEAQHGNCFICEQEIDLDLQRHECDIDHVVPLQMNGMDNESNFALVHSSCNRSKQASDLNVARILARFKKLQNVLQTQNRSPSLQDILQQYGGSSYPLSMKILGDRVKYSFIETGDTNIYEQSIYTDPISNFKYFFAVIPIEYLWHDNKINPRPIGSNVSKLVYEFYLKRPQLHVQLAYVIMESSQTSPVKVMVFDGQHKAAAQIMLGAKMLPLRIFINPDLDILLTTNTNAGTTLKQVAFDKSVQRHLGSELYQERITQYRKAKDLPEDSYGFSERDLIQFFKGESREMKRYILDAVRDAITHSPENKLIDYIDFGGRGKEKPFSYSTIEKTFFSFFIYQEVLDTPLDYQMAENQNPRELEIDQITRLMNIIAEKMYIEKFEPDIGTNQIESRLQRGEPIPDDHLASYRLAKEEICYNWLKLVHQLIKNYYLLRNEPYNENKLFQYLFPDELWHKIELFLQRLYELPVWRNRDLSLTIFGAKQNYNFWFTIFETGKSPLGHQVLSGKINIMEMIKE